MSNLTAGNTPQPSQEISVPSPKRIQRWKLCLAIAFTWWPLPASVWMGVHMNGWRITLEIFGAVIVATALFMYGLKLLLEIANAR